MKSIVMMPGGTCLPQSRRRHPELVGTRLTSGYGRQSGDRK